MSLNRPTRLVLGVIACAAAVSALIFLLRPTPTPPTLVPVSPGETVNVTTTPAEIFGRAFWRHPAAADKILHAERREWANADAASRINRWQWFLVIRPGPELLRDLRNPDTFGLIATPQPRPWLNPPVPLPAWFPAEAAGCEVLQAPSGHLTVLYRASDNTLYATDQGQGFAAAKPAP